MKSASTGCLIGFLFLFSVLPVIAGVNPSTKYQNVKSLNEHWLIYSKKHSAYVFYLPEIHDHTHTINQWLETEKYRNYLLKIYASPGLSLFANNRLLYRHSSHLSEWVVIPISKILPYQTGGQSLLTFYNSNYQLPADSTFIVCQYQGAETQLNISKITIKKRVIQNDLNVFVICFLLALTLTAFLKHGFVKRFEEFIGFKNTISAIWLEESATVKVFSIPMVLVILINSLFFALIIEFYGNLTGFLGFFGIRMVKIGALGQIAYCVSIFFLIFLAKYLLLLFMSLIFQLEDIIKVQFFELLKGLIKINFFITTLLLILVGTKTSNEGLAIYVPYLISMLLIYIGLRVAYLIFRLSPFRNIYLFSYLCTTEIIPLLIIIKIILFRSN